MGLTQTHICGTQRLHGATHRSPADGHHKSNQVLTAQMRITFKATEPAPSSTLGWLYYTPTQEGTSWPTSFSVRLDGTGRLPSTSSGSSAAVPAIQPEAKRGFLLCPSKGYRQKCRTISTNKMWHFSDM